MDEGRPLVRARPGRRIYVAKSFEPDGGAIAAKLGLATDAVKPLTWATCYAITVVAAK